MRSKKTTDGWQTQGKESTRNNISNALGGFSLPTAETHLHFDVVDVFRGAEHDLGVVCVVSTVPDVNIDVELLLVGLYDKAEKTKEASVMVNEYRQHFLCPDIKRVVASLFSSESL